MALGILQYPASASLAQSPVVFAVSESAAVVYSSSFQYNCDLYYWSGSTNQSSSLPNYQLVKYPNSSLSGIFDLSRILNSTLQAPLAANPSNVTYYAAEFYWSYLSGSSYPTGSRVRSGVYKALDGYALFDEPINQQIVSKSIHWPMMTDGPITQSFFDENKGTMGVFVGTNGLPIVPTEIAYTSATGFEVIGISGSISSSQQIQQVPMFPSQAGFPLSGSNLGDFYTIQPVSQSVVGGDEQLDFVGEPIRFEYKCKQKYPNVRIKWKNRYGQFDYFNFDMVSRTSFSTEARTYQPQIGSFESPTLFYNDYETSNQKYVVDSKQGLSVNTDWVDESYNDIFKQLLVSDEVYWVQNETTGTLTPITINTESVTFKTGVVDKVIQYAFDFEFGKAYKLIL